MALRSIRPRPPVQDENAGSSIHPGKPSGAGGLAAAAGNKGGVGLKQQPPALNERKTLSNITNKLQQVPPNASVGGTPVSTLKPGAYAGKTGIENVGGGKAAVKNFAVRADADNASANPGIQSTSVKVAPTARVPLRNITNGNQRQDQTQLENQKLAKQKPNVETQSASNPTFKFPPRSKLNLTEKMKQNAATWAQEGIEKVHFSGKDMEALREKIEDEEMRKRVAQVISYRTDLPIPPLRPRKDYHWEILDVLALDPLENFSEEEEPKMPNYEGLETWKLDMDFDKLLLSYSDSVTATSPPRIPEDWPQIREEPLEDMF